MSIVFPRDLPPPGFARCDFDLVRGDAVNRTYGGRVDSMELIDPYWSMKATTPNLTRRERAIWRAWNASLGGSSRKFYAWNPEAEYPMAYGRSVLDLLRHDGSAFDGTCTLTATAARALSLSALPDVFQFSIGDNISVRMTGAQRSLHLVTEEIVGANDGTATVAVEPPVRAGAVLDAGVQLVRASCIMVMVPGTFSAPAEHLPTPVSFEAVQTLA